MSLIPLSTIAVELLADHPELVALVAIAARLARAWQRGLSWPEYRVAHRLKRGVFPIVHRLAPGRILLVSEKGGRDDDEFLRTVDTPVREVVSQLRAAGGSPHLLNSLKRRPDTHGDPLSAAHVVWTHANGMQTECYLFTNADGSTDVYVHYETSVDDPLGHLTDPQRDGDVRAVVEAGLDGS
jgi:hypothetical protein